jgi:hypothetical protein
VTLSTVEPWAVYLIAGIVVCAPLLGAPAVEEFGRVRRRPVPRRNAASPARTRMIGWVAVHGPADTRRVLALHARWRSRCPHCPTVIGGTRDPKLRASILAAHIRARHTALP